MYKNIYTHLTSCCTCTDALPSAHACMYTRAYAHTYAQTQEHRHTVHAYMHHVFVCQFVHACNAQHRTHVRAGATAGWSTQQHDRWNGGLAGVIWAYLGAKRNRIALSQGPGMQFQSWDGPVWMSVCARWLLWKTWQQQKTLRDMVPYRSENRRKSFERHSRISKESLLPFHKWFTVARRERCRSPEEGRRKNKVETKWTSDVNTFTMSVHTPLHVDEIDSHKTVGVLRFTCFGPQNMLNLNEIGSWETS